MLSMVETAGDNGEKPARAPRFEAFVMTGEAILNLSRTTHSPEVLPIHSKRRRAFQNHQQLQQQQQQQKQQEHQPQCTSSSSVPTSPSELVEKDQIPQASTPIRCYKSEETLIKVHMEKEEQEVKKAPSKPELQAETEPIKEPDRIVWTYNAPLTGLSEKEMRRYEANQFWLNTLTDSTCKQQPKQTVVQTDSEKLVNNGSADAAEEGMGKLVNSGQFSCDSQIARESDGQQPTSAKLIEEEESNSVGPANSPIRPPMTRSSTEESESDADSLQSVHFSPKGVDMPSAIRLAKRLYTLDGFQKSDVSRHLSKNNEFNRVVAEEYLKHFNFEGAALDAALRRFLQAFQLTGESSERDRVLVHFSRRYLQANPNSFGSQDSVHILTCALLLLNSDLHGKHQGMKRMTCAQFIKRLSGLNDGGNFPVDLLRRLYMAIKDHALEWASDSPEGVPSPGELQEAVENMIQQAPAAKELASNPYLDIPTPQQSQEFKKGYVMRKCCVEPGGKRTSLGKRGWRMYFAVLKDLVLYLYKDEATCKGEMPPKASNTRCKKTSNTGTTTSEPGPAVVIRVHHALAASAPDYTKKKNVFRLFTADRAQFLIQASDAKEWRCWMDALNTAASLLSAPPLAAPCGSQQRFQRPLLPASLTKFSARDQLMAHEERVTLLEQEMIDHRANPPPAKAKSTAIATYREKDAYLHFEKTRYEAYIAVCSGLQAAFSAGNTLSRDISLLEMDEQANDIDSGQTSPEMAFNDDEDGTYTHHL